jgi:hypothetical protein
MNNGKICFYCVHYDLEATVSQPINGEVDFYSCHCYNSPKLGAILPSDATCRYFLEWVESPDQITFPGFEEID